MVYFIIGFIVGAVLMLVILAIAAMGKDDEPRNKVHFYVEIDRKDKEPKLYIQIIHGYKMMIAGSAKFKWFGLNPQDFVFMDEGKLVEVFINMED